EVETEQPAVGVRELERAAIAVGVGHQVRAARERSPVLLPLVPDETDDAAGLAVEAAPEPDHLVLLRVGLGEADRGLDRLGASAVEVSPRDRARGQLCDQLHQLKSGLRSEASDRQALELARHRGAESRMRMPE